MVLRRFWHKRQYSQLVGNRIPNRWEQQSRPPGTAVPTDGEQSFPAIREIPAADKPTDLLADRNVSKNGESSLNKKEKARRRMSLVHSSPCFFQIEKSNFFQQTTSPVHLSTDITRNIIRLNEQKAYPCFDCHMDFWNTLFNT